MEKKQKTILLVIFIAIVAFVGLWGVDLSQGYHMVSDISSDPEKYVGANVNTMGSVKQGTLDISTSGTRFVLEDLEEPGFEIGVEYTGSLPVSLSEGQSISISGKMISDELIEASNIVASCPSKYSE